jgi:hypothetical protein
MLCCQHYVYFDDRYPCRAPLGSAEPADAGLHTRSFWGAVTEVYLHEWRGLDLSAPGSEESAEGGAQPASMQSRVPINNSIPSLALNGLLLFFNFCQADYWAHTSVYIYIYIYIYAGWPSHLISQEERNWCRHCNCNTSHFNRIRNFCQADYWAHTVDTAVLPNSYNADALLLLSDR